MSDSSVRGGKTAVTARTRGRRPRHRVAQVRDPAVLAGFSVEALQRAYDAGLVTYESMYDMVQLKRQQKQFNVAACEAVVHESGATNFDVSVPVPYSTFSRLPHVAPEFLPAIIQGAPVAYPLSSRPPTRAKRHAPTNRRKAPDPEVTPRPRR